jgi:signal transduction histidine kinase
MGVLLAAGVGWWMSRKMSEPLLALTQTTGRMAQGDLSTRAQIARWDEFGVLADAFNHMARRVEETVVTLRRFAADAAHELYTPLTALRTQLELALDDGPDQRHHLEQAQMQLARLETLTTDLLDLSRLESGAAQLNIQPVNLNHLLQTLAESYASQAEQAGISFSLYAPQQRTVTSGNEAQLHRAIGNLLDNALKFTPSDGNISLGLNIAPDETFYEIWIEDSGIGIPDDELDQLFNRFHRGRNAAGYGGNGLGLAIVKVIVDRHKGRVQAENTQTGSRFTIRLTVV